jgi:MFS family permease
MESAGESSLQERRADLILLDACLGQFIVGLDQRSLLVALPTLARYFQTDLTTIQWVLFIYDLTLIGLVITAGRLGDIFGRRRFYTPGLLIFVSVSALCDLSGDPFFALDRDHSGSLLSSDRINRLYAWRRM